MCPAFSRFSARGGASLCGIGSTPTLTKKMQCIQSCLGSSPLLLSSLLPLPAPSSCRPLAPSFSVSWHPDARMIVFYNARHNPHAYLSFLDLKFPLTCLPSVLLFATVKIPRISSQTCLSLRRCQEAAFSFYARAIELRTIGYLGRFTTYHMHFHPLLVFCLPLIITSAALCRVWRVWGPARSWHGIQTQSLY